MESSLCNRDHCKNPQPTKVHSCAAQSQPSHTKEFPHIRLREHCRRRGRKIVRARVFLWDCLLVTPEAKSIVSPTWLPKHEMNEDSSRHAKAGGGAWDYTKNHKHLRKSERMGEIVFPREQDTKWLSNTEWSHPENIHEKHYTDWAACIYVFRNMHAYTYTYM